MYEEPATLLAGTLTVDMEALEAELVRIDSRLVQYAKQLHDNIISVAALKTLSAKQLQEDHGLPPGPAATISAAYISQGGKLPIQLPFRLSHSIRVKTIIKVLNISVKAIQNLLGMNIQHAAQN